MTERDILELLLQKVTSIETEQKHMKDQLANIETEQKHMKDQLVNIETEQKHMKGQLDAIEMRQNGMKQEQVAIIHNQEATNALLKVLTEDVNYIKGDVIEVKDKLENQEKILERLSLRSIEHEADIAELRRIK